MVVRHPVSMERVSPTLGGDDMKGTAPKSEKESRLLRRGLRLMCKNVSFLLRHDLADLKAEEDVQRKAIAKLIGGSPRIKTMTQQEYDSLKKHDALEESCLYFITKD